MNEAQKMVLEFHKAFKVPFRSIPDANLPIERQDLRLDLIDEEFQELIAAMAEGDIIAIADAFADLLYVTYGGAVEYGIDIDEVFKEVHRSNMSKLETCMDCKGTGKLRGGSFRNQPNHTLMVDCVACGGQGNNPILREDGKVLKGSSYSPPDIKKCLERQFLRD